MGDCRYGWEEEVGRDVGMQDGDQANSAVALLYEYIPPPLSSPKHALKSVFKNSCKCMKIVYQQFKKGRLPLYSKNLLNINLV